MRESDYGWPAILDAKREWFGFFPDWEDSARLYGEGCIFSRWQMEPWACSWSGNWQRYGRREAWEEARCFDGRPGHWDDEAHQHSRRSNGHLEDSGGPRPARPD